MRSIIISFVVALILCPTFSAYAKPAPPKELTLLMEPLAELEESFEDEEWEETEEARQEITDTLDSILQKYEAVFPSIYRKRLANISETLQSAIIKKNDDAVENAYLTYQLFVFEVMDEFDYKIHPILTTLRRYILDEAREAFDEGDYDDVFSEMREAEAFFLRVSKLLSAHGISADAINAFYESINAALENIEAGNTDGLNESLMKLQVLLDSFQKSYI